MSYKDLPEREIVSLFKEGNESAFEIIYDNYWVYLHRIASRFTQSSVQADDLVQELFVDLWCKREYVNEEKSIRPYLASAMYYKVAKYMRAQGAGYRRNFVRRVKDQYYKNGEHNPIEETVNFDNLEAWLEVELKRIPLKSQRIFKLSRCEHFSNREIAEQLNISTKNVEHHLSKALSSLRASLDERTDLIYTILTALFIS